MTKEDILKRHKETIDSVSAYDHTAVVCNVAETWELLEDVYSTGIATKVKLEQQVTYWKNSFKKQVESTRE